MSKSQITALKSTKEKRQTIRQKVLDFIKERGKANEYQILARIGGKRASIIGRLSELQDDGIIYVSGTFNGKMNSIYSYEPDMVKRLQHSAKRDIEKYNKWKKLGIKNGWFKD